MVTTTRFIGDKKTAQHIAALQSVGDSYAFGICFREQSIAQVCDKLIEAAQTKNRTRVAFVNAHCINEMFRSPVYDAAVRSADLVLPDGSGLAIAAMLASGRRCPNLNGTDLAPALMQRARDNGLSVFLLGARPGVAKKAAKILQAEYPGLRIAGECHGYFSADENDKVIARINAAKPDIVLAAFGVPKQDVWLADNAGKLTAPVTLGVGGLLDFISGRIPRAPIWLRTAGLEWTYRLYQEPKRMWRRYILGNPAFLGRAVAAAAPRLFKTARKALDEVVRRMIDIIGAGAGLAILAPLLAATALAIRLESEGPAIFKQVRIGTNGTPFTMYKFRSMSKDAERAKEKIEHRNHHGENAVTFKLSNDPRITTIGRFIRKFSIDELPQLWNVLIGDMSLVGPRPALPSEVAKYTEFEKRRLAVKPGITCIWQIAGRADIDFQGQVELDLQYIKRRSVFHDIWILLQTPIAVATARGAY